MTEEKVTIFYDYEFSREELEEIAANFSSKFAEKETLEDQKKAAMSQYKAQIDAMEAEISYLTTLHRSKKETRKVEAILKLNHTTKKREYYHPDTGEKLKEDDFRPEDYQRKLDMD